MKSDTRKDSLSLGKSSYVLGLLGILGAVTMSIAVLVAWPAFSYIAEKLI